MLSARPRIRRLEPPPFDPLNARAAELAAAGHHVISLGQAVPFFSPPGAALDAARAAVGHARADRYLPDPGLPSLREALAERLSTPASDEIIITAGANHAFTLALATILDPDEEVVLHGPYFTNHHGAVVAAGGIPVEAPVADRETFRVRWSDLEPHVTPRTRAVALCNPSNPTGAPVTRADGAEIARELARRGIFLVSDETYMHFVYDEPHWSALSLPNWRENVIVVGTFSKSFGLMGWRVGFAVAGAALCVQAIKVQDAMIICAPAISQIAAEAAVRQQWEHARRFHGELRARRQALGDALRSASRLHWTPAGGGLFEFVRVEGCRDSARLARDLLEEAHVITIPGVAFGASGEGCLRVSYGFASAADLHEAGRRIRAYLS